MVVSGARREERRGSTASKNRRPNPTPNPRPRTKQEEEEEEEEEAPTLLQHVELRPKVAERDRVVVLEHFHGDGRAEVRRAVHDAKLALADLLLKLQLLGVDLVW